MVNRWEYDIGVLVYLKLVPNPQQYALSGKNEKSLILRFVWVSGKSMLYSKGLLLELKVRPRYSLWGKSVLTLHINIDDKLFPAANRGLIVALGVRFFVKLCFCEKVWDYGSMVSF